MKNEKPIYNVAEMDQARAAAVDVMPKLWWGLFDESMKQGFTRDESLKLVCVYIQASAMAMK